MPLDQRVTGGHKPMTVSAGNAVEVTPDIKTGANFCELGGRPLTCLMRGGTSRGAP
jgi:hypothetical protein